MSEKVASEKFAEYQNSQAIESEERFILQIRTFLATHRQRRTSKNGIIFFNLNDGGVRTAKIGLMTDE